MVFGRQVQAQLRKQSENVKEKDKLKPQKVDYIKSLQTPASLIQQSIGNHAAHQMLQHMSHAAPKNSVLQGLPIHLQQFAILIAIQAEQEGEQKLWTEFEQLSAGQRLALLSEWYKKIELIESNGPTWKEWHLHINNIKHVQLQLDEVKREADPSKQGKQQTPYDMSQVGMLVPYREAWLWLNYKGNKQGKAELLQRLDQLSIQQKQLLLHRLNGKGKINLYQISNNLTIEEHLQQWIDWEQIENELATLNRLDKEEVEQQLEILQQETNELELEEAMEETVVEEADEQSSLFGLVGLLVPDNKRSSTPEELPIEKRLQNPDEMSRILFGVPIALLTDKAGLASKDQLLDRILDLENSKLPPKKLEQERINRLQKLGYTSNNQLLMVLKISIIELLFDIGVTRDDKQFMLILQQLGLTKQQKRLKKELIAMRIHSI